MTKERRTDNEMLASLMQHNEKGTLDAISKVLEEDVKPKKVVGRPFEKGNPGRPRGTNTIDKLGKKLKSRREDPVNILIDMNRDIKQAIKSGEAKEQGYQYVLKAYAHIQNTCFKFIEKQYATPKYVEQHTTSDNAISIKVEMPSIDTDTQNYLDATFMEVSRPNIADNAVNKIE